MVVPSGLRHLTPRRMKTAPKLRVRESKTGASRLVELTKKETAVVYYGFTFSDDGETAHCREAYENAEGLKAHMANVGSALGELLASGCCELVRIELHGPASELAKLRDDEAIKPLNPVCFTLQDGAICK